MRELTARAPVNARAGELSDWTKPRGAREAEQLAITNNGPAHGDGFEIHPVGPTGAAVSDDGESPRVRVHPVLHKPINVSAINEIHPPTSKLLPGLLHEAIPIAGKRMNCAFSVCFPVGDDASGAFDVAFLKAPPWPLVAARPSLHWLGWVQPPR